MLGAGRYLLGVAEVLLLVGAAAAGARSLRERLLPGFGGASAALATAALAAALLIWPAELLGSFGALEPAPYLILVAAAGLGLWGLLARARRGGGVRPRPGTAQAPAAREERRAAAVGVPDLIGLLVAAIAVAHFAVGVRTRLTTGMTGFDSTWYHGPFAAGFFQSGDTWRLHFIAPQFLAWFYPANGEIFHAIGMLAFGRDVLSPFLNLGWLLGCLLACWCIGRPYRVAPWSLALGAIALSVPALADQAGEARNDLVALFFLLAGVAVALNAWAGARTARRAAEAEGPGPGPGAPTAGAGLGPILVVGLCAGLAAGTKLNFLLPAGVLVLGACLCGRGPRGRALAAGAAAALAGGGYWYLRNLVHAGSPLPWIHHLGPFSLPAPAQALGGREAHSVLGYLSSGAVWSHWFLPGLRGGLWIVWPLLVAGALAGLLLAAAALLPPRRRTEGGRRRAAEPLPGGGGRTGALAAAGFVGLASGLAWLIAPTSASGPTGMPRGFESGLRYLAPALVLGLALLPAAPPLRRLLTALGGNRRGWIPEGCSRFRPASGRKLDRAGRPGAPRAAWALAAAVLALAVAAGYPIQRHYLANRYRHPTFTAPGLDAAFAWAQSVSGARIATTGTRQYPLFGVDLSNRVQYLGLERPHGGFEAPATCRQYRRLLDRGRYDYVVATYDRVEPGNPAYPPAAGWTEGPGAEVVLRRPPTVVFRLTAPLLPSGCAARSRGPSPGPSRQG